MFNSCYANLKSILFCIFLVSIFTSIIPQNIFSQEANNCFTSVSGCGQWSTPVIKTFNLQDPNCIITISLQTRTCLGGAKEFKYEKLNVQGNCNNLDKSGSVEQFSINSLNELIDILLIESTAGNGQGDISSLPDCPLANDPTYVDNGSYAGTRRIYSAACGVWLKCTYDVNPTPPECDRGINPIPAPTIGKVDVWQWFPCGEVCCMRYYQICKYTSGTPATSKVYIKKKGNGVKIGECTNDPNGPEPKFEKPCENGCN